MSVYIDDIIIYTNGTLADYRRKVGDVLQKLIDTSLQYNITKSEFEQDLVKYLGFIIEAKKGIYVDLKKIEAIRA